MRRALSRAAPPALSLLMHAALLWPLGRALEPLLEPSPRTAADAAGLTVTIEPGDGRAPVPARPAAEPRAAPDPPAAREAREALSGSRRDDGTAAEAEPRVGARSSFDTAPRAQPRTPLEAEPRARPESSARPEPRAEPRRQPEPEPRTEPARSIAPPSAPEADSGTAGADDEASGVPTAPTPSPERETVRAARAEPPPDGPAVATVRSGVDGPDPATAAAPTDGVRDDYRSQLRAALERVRRYPRSARRRRLEGTAEIRFTLDRQGDLLERTLVSGSGHAVLDEEALALPGRAAPLPPIPPALAGETLTLVVPIAFRLR